jgi:chromate transport protein ChrA
MYWTGANIIIFSSILGILIATMFQLIDKTTKTSNDSFNLILQILICILIIVLYFSFIHFDFIIIAYLFTFLALVDLIFNEEKI